MERIVLKKKSLLCSQIPRNRMHTCHAGLYGKHWGWPGGRGGDGEMWARVFIVISVGRNRPGRANRFRAG